MASAAKRRASGEVAARACRGFLWRFHGPELEGNPDIPRIHHLGVGLLPEGGAGWPEMKVRSPMAAPFWLEGQKAAGRYGLPFS